MSLKIYAPGRNPNLPRYNFYAGAETLIFDKAAWTYFRVMPDGSLQPQDGVTTVLHATINRAEPLMGWAVKRGYKGVRKKKGCNGTDIMCEACANKYRERNGESANAVASTKSK